MGFVASRRSRPGGGRRIRTDGLFNAIEALSQLSYTPTARRKLYRTSLD